MSISEHAEALPDFYHPDLEAQLRVTEAHAGRPIKRLVSEDLPILLEERERASVSKLMAVQLVRTPSFFRQILPLATKHWLDDDFRDRKISAEFYSRECQRLSTLCPESNNPPNVLDHWVSDAINEKIDEMALDFYTANWTIAEVTRGLNSFEFVTGDNPVSLAQTHDNPEAGALLPLSPRRVLWVGDRFGERQAVELETVSLTLAKEINRLTVISSDRHVYARTRQELSQG